MKDNTEKNENMFRFVSLSFIKFLGNLRKKILYIIYQIHRMYLKNIDISMKVLL